jgi:glutaredoxin
VPFAARNVAEDAEAREEPRVRTGRLAVPVIVVGDETIVGFDRGRLARVLGLRA